MRNIYCYIRYYSLSFKNRIVSKEKIVSKCMIRHYFFRTNQEKS